MECACAENHFNTVNFDVENDVKNTAKKLRAEHIYVFS